MEDIIEQIPVACGDKDCPVQYHMEYYWIYMGKTGKRCRFSVCDADGNHEDIKRRDVPTPARAAAAWREYYEYCARTGLDPVGEFLRDGAANRPAKKIRYRARLSRWIGESVHGLKALEFSRGRGPWRPASEMPGHVAEYLGAAPFKCAGWVMGEFKSIAALRDAMKGNDSGRFLRRPRREFLRPVIEFTVDEPGAPVPAAVIAAKIRKAARAAISKIEKGGK